MSLENKALVRRYFEHAPRNPDVCDEIFASSFQFHTIQRASVTPQVITSTPQSEKAAYEWLKTVWGDWSMTIDEMIAEGDRVMARWTFHGTHEGEFSGLPPTYKQIVYSGINIFRIAEGKIAEIWDISDRLWMWQQLDVLPELKQAIEKAKGAMSPQQG
ncbi:MAG: ester cyclase [Proteobacteria bacterium]|nr:ester cyclase [Pseudomonadota bacterium]